MKIQPVSKNNTNFGRALSTEEKLHAKKVQEEALQYLGIKRIITIIPEPAFPSSTDESIGHGQLNSKSTNNFLDFWKFYTGTTDIKILPQGEIRPKSGYYGAYNSSSLTLGINTINPATLAEEDMGMLVSKDSLKSLYETNKKTQQTGLANFENTVGNNSKLNTVLKEAYENFLKSDNPKIKKLKEEFKIYKTENQNTIEGRALYETLSDIHKSSDSQTWPELDKHLFNRDIISDDIRNTRIHELKSTHDKDIEFCYFKQFLADKGLKQAKGEFNKKGINLVGDCLIGFSEDEIWSHPKAFLNANVASKDWELKALDFASLNDENSQAAKLLKLKVSQFAKRYDSIRFDVGWSYINPIIYPDKNCTLPNSYIKDTNNSEAWRIKKPLGTKALELIEKTVRDTKGQEYNLSNLMYEIEAGPSEFSAYWNKKTIIPELRGRTIVQSSAYMNSGYATIPFMEETMHIQRKNYIFMAGNHDHLALNALACGIDNDDVMKANGDNIQTVLQQQMKPLAKGLNLNEQTLQSKPTEFVKAKFAYNFLAENIKMFFMDIFGRTEQFDSQRKNSSKNYRYMIPNNYEDKLHQNIQKGNGFNIFDSLHKAIKSKGINQHNSGLLSELEKYAQILYEPGVTTEKEANKLNFKIDKNNTTKKITKASKSHKGLIAFVGIVAGFGTLYKIIQTKNDKSGKKQ